MVEGFFLLLWGVFWFGFGRVRSRLGRIALLVFSRRGKVGLVREFGRGGRVVLQGFVSLSSGVPVFGGLFFAAMWGWSFLSLLPGLEWVCWIWGAGFLLGWVGFSVGFFFFLLWVVCSFFFFLVISLDSFCCLFGPWEGCFGFFFFVLFLGGCVCF